MSYIRLNLETGDTFEASHVKHLEDGIVALENNIALSANYVETQMGSLSGSSITNSTNTVIIYNIPVEAGYKIGLTDYSTYMYYIKSIDFDNNTNSDYTSSWLKEEYTFSGPKPAIAVYVRNHEKSELDSSTAPEEVSKLFYLKDANNNVIYGIQTNTSTGNNITINQISLAPYELRNNQYNSNYIIELPSEFGAFPLDIKISQQNNVYGCDIQAYHYIKNTSNINSYFIATDGSDSNDGLSPSTPLLTLDSALSKEDVDTIFILEGNYYNGVNYTAGLEISKEINIIGIGNVHFYNTSSPIDITNACYIENIIFDGGISALTTHLTTQLVVFNKCKFLNATGNNGLTALGGYFILEKCEASGNYLDGFNYHSYNGYYNFVIEIECYGFNNGTKKSGINNASTMHESGKIIRINGTYGISNGGVVADADGAKSLNYGCVAYCNQFLTNENRMGNYVCIGTNSAIWLYDCISFGSKYDIICDAGKLYTNKTYIKEFAPNSGTILRIE